MAPKRPSAVAGLRRAAAVPRTAAEPSAPAPADVLPVTTMTTEAPTAAAKPEKWPARISMTASREMKRELESARIDDGIEVTARLRAMIALWQEDPQLRARIDLLAKDLR